MSASDSSDQPSNKKDIERRKDSNSHDHVEAEEVKIHVQGEESQHQKSPPFNRQFQLRTNGCLTTLIAILGVVVLFTVFLPLGIVILLGTAGYLSWKYRHLLKNMR